MKKKLLSQKMLVAFSALLFLMTMMPLMTKAVVINTVTSSETITKTSTVYVGEVVVDGVTQIKYLYSGDLTLSVVVRGHLLDALNGMADGDYATLLESYWPDAYNPPQHFAFCSDSELTAAMDENWSSAQYVGTLYYPDKTVSSEINSNLYDIDEGFRAALDAKTQDRIEAIDNLANAEKCIVSHLGVSSVDNVYYTVEDGQIVKHVDTTITYDSEVTTVIYTKVELSSGSSNSKLGDMNGDGDVNVTDVALLVGHILGIDNSNFIIENADVNGDGSITVTDVTKLISIILEGDKGDTPKVYLTCPDENHPHLIDLGLPSGTKWACCNVDADKPEDYGGYYAWGEVQEKEDYYEVTYQYATGVEYDSDGTYDDYHSDTGLCGIWQNLASDIAGTEYDVAHVQWGGSWVMPSIDQFKELLDNCNYTWITLNDKKGGLFTGSNGVSIFLPAAGGRWIEGITYGVGYGYYWLSAQDPSDLPSASCFYFDSFGVNIESYLRSSGLTVRPVSR